ncbi:MAG: hypothetical protein J0L97_00560 [Alphaproteobacteria bacterium]|nr:hypothetical protein [Alphaproteobacteria bacterium]
MGNRQFVASQIEQELNKAYNQSSFDYHALPNRDENQVQNPDRVQFTLTILYANSANEKGVESLNRDEAEIRAIFEAPIFQRNGFAINLIGEEQAVPAQAYDPIHRRSDLPLVPRRTFEITIPPVLTDEVTEQILDAIKLIQPQNRAFSGLADVYNAALGKDINIPLAEKLRIGKHLDEQARDVCDRLIEPYKIDPMGFQTSADAPHNFGFFSSESFPAGLIADLKQTFGEQSVSIETDGKFNMLFISGDAAAQATAAQALQNQKKQLD